MKEKVGIIFILKYTTDGTPYSKPKITSGYGILKQQGELIFRTTAHQEDVNSSVLLPPPLFTFTNFSPRTLCWPAERKIPIRVCCVDQQLQLSSLCVRQRPNPI
jgi:hypothetical protein